MGPRHSLKYIRLELARSKEFPSGSASHGYDLIAPLDADGHIDPQLWREHRAECRVRRFWNGQDSIGALVHRLGGVEHARWMFDYGTGLDDDEAGYRFRVHRFSTGEYVSIRNHDGEMHTFCVASVEPLGATP